MNINEIINKTFNTTQGYLYLIDLIKKRFPSLTINENNLKNLKIEVMSENEFRRTGFTGIYYAESNTIKVFTNYDKDGKQIFNDDIIKDYLNDKTILNTFLHELIHACTSKTDKNGRIFEGINIRLPHGQNSFFIAINEGITQMITDTLLNEESDAYPFETNFAKQLSLIIGEENLIKIYSSNNPQLLIDAIDKLGADALFLITQIYDFYVIEHDTYYKNSYNVGDIIQDLLITLYNNSTLTCDEEFHKLLLDEDKIKKFISLLPNKYVTIQDLGFVNINEIIKSFGKRKK